MPAVNEPGPNSPLLLINGAFYAVRIGEVDENDDFLLISFLRKP